MKTVLAFCMLAFCAAESAADAYFEHYRDWKLVQEKIVSTNKGNDVRLHFDMSNPMHGPWLSNPAADAMTVSFVSRVNCGAAIEYREKGTRKWTRKWETTYGMIDHSKRVHVFHLDGLKSATEYEYRFAVASSQYQIAYWTTVVGRQIWSFKTFDPARRDFSVFVTADVHGASRIYLDPMYSRTGADKADFFIFLGDNVNDTMHQPEFYITSGYLDDVVRLWGPSRPTLFLRGNHDSWGYEAAKAWATWHGHPEGRGYYAVTQGNALFICFDVAEEYRCQSIPAGKEVSDAYCEQEARWLKDLKKTPAWKNARWRIALSHFGVVTGGNDSHSRRFTGYFGETLNDPADPVDLMLCGHEHRYLRCNAGSTNTVYGAHKLKPKQITPVTKSWNFTEISVEYNGVVMLEIGERTLRAVSKDVFSKNGRILDEVTLKK